MEQGDRRRRIEAKVNRIVGTRHQQGRLASPGRKACISLGAAAVAVLLIEIFNRDAHDNFYLTGASVVAVLFLAFVIDRQKDFRDQDDPFYKLLILGNVLILLIAQLDTLWILAGRGSTFFDAGLVAGVIAFCMTSLSLSFIKLQPSPTP